MLRQCRLNYDGTLLVMVFLVRPFSIVLEKQKGGFRLNYESQRVENATSLFLFKSKSPAFHILECIIIEPETFKNVAIIVGGF